MESAVIALRPWLLAVAREMLGPELQSKFGASDIVQQTYVEAIRDLPKYRGNQIAQLRKWLLSLLQNNFRDAIKAFRGSQMRDVSLESALGNNGVIDYRGKTESRDHGELAAQVLEAIGKLPNAQQRMLHWRFSEQLSYAEIALRVDRSEDAVRMMINRTLNAMKQRFANE